MPLSRKEKSDLYDDLMKDVKEFVNDLEKHYQNIEDIESRPELADQTSPDLRRSMLIGMLKGSNFGLRLKLDRFKGKLNWFRGYEQKYGNS